MSERGLDYLEIDFSKQAFLWTTGAVPGGLCLFAVESPTPEMKEKGYGHFVVGIAREYGDSVEYKVLHDPLGEVKGPYTITAIGFFIPLRPEEAGK